MLIRISFDEKLKNTLVLDMGETAKIDAYWYVKRYGMIIKNCDNTEIGYGLFTFTDVKNILVSMESNEDIVPPNLDVTHKVLIGIRQQSKSDRCYSAFRQLLCDRRSPIGIQYAEYLDDMESVLCYINNIYIKRDSEIKESFLISLKICML